MATRTHYDNLKIPRNASIKEIKKAYRQLAQKYHPDRNGNSDESQRIMKIINQAYAVLSNPESRRAYDQKLREQEQEERQKTEQSNQQASSRQSCTKEEEEWEQETYQQSQAEKMQHQQNTHQQTKTPKKKVQNEKNTNLREKIFWLTIAVIIIFIVLEFMSSRQSFRENPISNQAPTIPTSTESPSDSELAWLDDTNNSASLASEIETASSIEESMQAEIDDLKAQLEAANAASEAAAEKQRQEQEIAFQNKLAQCRQFARNIGYYETVASLCEFTPSRSNNEIATQWELAGCNNYMNVAEAKKEVETSARNLENKISQIDDNDAYDEFCRKEQSFWRKVDSGRI